MPMVAAAVLAYVAGLLAGYAGWSACIVGLALAGMVVAAHRRDVAIGAVAVLGSLGVAAALTAMRDERACLTRLTSQGELRVALLDDARPGSRVRGQTVDNAGCAVDFAAAISEGRATAGTVVRVRGRALPAAHGLVIADAWIWPTGEVDHLLRWRGRAARAIDLAFGRDAPLARALLIADTRQIAVDTRDRFAAAGLIHVLSISGLHVAILAAALELLLGVARVPRAHAALGATALAAAYVALIGFPSPAVRAVSMLGAATAAQLVQRPTSPWAVLAIGAAVPLCAASHTVLDLGYQLSVAGMAALVAGGSFARRRLRPRLSGWRLRIVSELATSTIASIVAAPLVAWWFGRVSLVGPVANLVAAPIVALLQPTLFLVLAAAPWPGLSRFIAGAAHPLLAALDLAARVGSEMPLAVLHVASTVLAVVLAGLAAVAVLATCVSRHPERPAVTGLLAAAALAWLPADAGSAPGTVELHMLDVGQGDALALRTPAGRWVLFDAGPAWSSGDAGRRVVVPYVRRLGGHVAAFVLSHPHLDHVGGAASAIDALRPDEYWDAGYPGGGERYHASLAAAAADDVRWRRARPGDSLGIDGVVVRFLAPDSGWAAALPDANDASTIALVQYGAVRFLLVGDAEEGEETWLLAHDRASLQADVLKVGHHGSRTSTTPEFLAAVRPRVALVSVGLGNDYGHPSADVIRRLAESGADVARTDLLGTVVVRTDGRQLTIIADGTEWPVSSRASATAPWLH